jgi:hypothetical protein
MPVTSTLSVCKYILVSIQTNLIEWIGLLSKLFLNVSYWASFFDKYLTVPVCIQYWINDYSSSMSHNRFTEPSPFQQELSIFSCSPFPAGVIYLSMLYFPARVIYLSMLYFPAEVIYLPQVLLHVTSQAWCRTRWTVYSIAWKTNKFRFKVSWVLSTQKMLLLTHHSTRQTTIWDMRYPRGLVPVR